MDLDNRFDSKLFPKVWIRCPRFSFTTNKYVISVDRVTYTKPQSFVTAKHEHSIFEIHYFPSGGGTATIENTTYTIRPGTFLITGPHVFHSQLSGNNDLTEEYSILLDISLSKPNRASENFAIYAAYDKILDIIVQNKSFFGNDTNNAYTYLKNLHDVVNDKDAHEINTSVFWLAIMQTLLATAKNIQPLPVFIDHKPNDLNHSRLGILDDIFRGYWIEMTPEIAAKKLGISVRQLNRITEKQFGMTFKQKYTNSRIEHAPMLLENLDILSIDEIAQKLNFSSLQYFSKHFKAVYGITPAQYRRQHINNLTHNAEN